METIGNEFDSLSELPPLPQQFIPMEYYRNYSSVIINPPPPLPHDSLPPFPPSDFTFSDTHNHKDVLDSSLSLSHSDSFFLDSSLDLLNRYHHTTESTHFEHLFNEINAAAAPTPPRFIHLPDLNDVATATTPFLHLPELKSFEQTTTTTTAETETTMTTTSNLYLSLSPPLPVEKLRLNSFSISSSPSKSPTASFNSSVSKRKCISNKIRSLEKLMPWEKRMNLAKILEETHRYIRFLQSQIASFQWMPLESVYNTTGEVQETDLLKSLTRQQILQVLANSPGSLNVLSARGSCVFSYEQILSLKTMSRNL